MRSLLLALLALASFRLCYAHSETTFVQQLGIERLSFRQEAAISLTAFPTILPAEGGPVKVSLSGVPEPSSDDWVGIYSPSNVDITTSWPVAFRFANTSKEYLSRGEGIYEFDLLNIRANYVFVLLRGQDTPVVLATSNLVNVTNPEFPTGGHLAFQGDPTTMAITWTSLTAGGNPRVIFGTSPNKLFTFAAATSTTYSESDLCGPPATGPGWRDPGQFHTALMTGLEPSTMYYYTFGGDLGGFSEIFSFKTSAEPNPSANVRLAIFGDMGGAPVDGSLTIPPFDDMPNGLNTTGSLLHFLPQTDIVLHIGDISYARGYAADWEIFMHQIQPVATKVPYQTCIGNHERDWPDSGVYYNSTDSGGECGVPYEKRFHMPRPALDEAWYSFEFGNVHVVMMSTEHIFTKGSDQWIALEQYLQNVDRTRTPWLIFAGHRPMYIDSTSNGTTYDDQNVALFLRENVEELLLKYNVDICFWGHHHTYQRTCPVNDNVCQEAGKAPVHIVVGTAGASLNNNIETELPPQFVFVEDTVHGHVRVQTTSTELSGQFIRNGDLEILDTFTLTK